MSSSLVLVDHDHDADASLETGEHGVEMKLARTRGAGPARRGQQQADHDRQRGRHGHRLG
jgi:hypothetical protein